MPYLILGKLGATSCRVSLATFVFHCARAILHNGAIHDHLGRNAPSPKPAVNKVGTTTHSIKYNPNHPGNRKMRGRDRRVDDLAFARGGFSCCTSA